MHCEYEGMPTTCDNTCIHIICLHVTFAVAVVCEAATEFNMYLLARSTQNVGCDNRFDGAQSDRCGVCNGDGSSCSLVQRTYSATNQQFGEQRTNHCHVVCALMNAR